MIAYENGERVEAEYPSFWHEPKHQSPHDLKRRFAFQAALMVLMGNVSDAQKFATENGLCRQAVYAAAARIAVRCGVKQTLSTQNFRDAARRRALAVHERKKRQKAPATGKTAGAHSGSTEATQHA